MPSAISGPGLAIRPHISSASPTWDQRSSEREHERKNLKHRPCTSFPESNDFLASLNFSHLQLPGKAQHPSKYPSDQLNHPQPPKDHHQQHIQLATNYNFTHNPHIPAQYSYHERTDRPAKRPMPTPTQTIAVVNSSGRQAASFIRVAVAVGYHVRAQLRNLDGIVASEISSLQNVTVLVGELYNKPNAPHTSPTVGPAAVDSTNGRKGSTGVNQKLVDELFQGCQLAFINTTFWGDEIAIGKACADAAVRANVQHYIYSSMPNHSLLTPESSSPWPSLPLWSAKMEVELYIRSLSSLFPKSTFLYTGIYNNNFTSLPYPLFCMELQSDGSFKWEAPFHPDVKLPWLDAEHDIGPAVIQLIKDGVNRWGKGERIALAYEMLSPREACKAFERGVGRRVRYKHSLKIKVKVKIPTGYRDQLVALEEMYALGAKEPNLQPPYFGNELIEKSCPDEAMELWEGHRGLEEYAREVFPTEEAANGLTWMNDGENTDGEEGRVQGGEEEEEGDDDDDALTMGGGTGGENTPARKEEAWLA